MRLSPRGLGFLRQRLHHRFESCPDYKKIKIKTYEKNDWDNYDNNLDGVCSVYNIIDNGKRLDRSNGLGLRGIKCQFNNY